MIFIATTAMSTFTTTIMYHQGWEKERKIVPLLFLNFVIIPLTLG